MPKYLFTGSFTAQGGRGVLSEGGSARVRAVRVLFDSLGGKLESYYFAFGADDYLIIGDMPDNATALSAAMMVGSSGAVANRTVALLTAEDVDEASRKAPIYRAPGE